VVLRLDPGDGLLAPYDMEHQFRVYRALEGSGVPVPKVYWLELDRRVLGAPFYVMELLAGESPGRLLDETDRRTYAPRLDEYVRVLATIHGVDWRARGLHFLESPGPGSLAHRRIDAIEGFIRRVQWQPEEDLDEAIAWLREHAPPASDAALIHGDCSLSNYLFVGNRVNAVLDWELCAISDPLEDVAFFCGLIPMFRGELSHADQERLRSDFLERYQAATGRGYETFEFWEALSHLKCATIVLSGQALARRRGLEPPGTPPTYRRCLQAIVRTCNVSIPGS
jgi:aminoglycoside phosphotransferase (APT) family kinase protein